MKLIQMVILTIMVVTLPAPSAGAGATCASDPATLTQACLIESSSSMGSCDTTGFESGTDQVIVAAGSAVVSARGSQFCSSSGASSNGVFVAVFSDAGFAFASWSESTSSTGTSTCTIRVVTVAGPVVQPCPAGGPPNPNWGHLLP